jgi:hypothetical protein
MSLLTIVQDVCGEIGIPIPASVVGSNSELVQQLFRLAKREGEQLSSGASVGLSYDWTELQSEATWTSTATELQGALATLAPGFRYIINDTIFDRTEQWQQPGPLSPVVWQWRKAATASGPYPEWRIRAGGLYMYPVPSAGHTMAFEYASSYWCQDSSGTAKVTWTADDDTARLDEEWFKLGLIWRWRKAKGLDYAEDFRSYQITVTHAMGRDGGKPRLTMDNKREWPRVVTPEGNWAP